jgi:uncharacterized transporter YbjL
MRIINRLRPEDQWLLLVSSIAVLFFTLALYAGTLRLRLLGFALGLPGIIFTTYIIRRSYTPQRARIHLMLCLAASGLLAYGLFLLTN